MTPESRDELDEVLRRFAAEAGRVSVATGPRGERSFAAFDSPRNTFLLLTKYEHFGEVDQRRDRQAEAVDRQACGAGLAGRADRLENDNDRLFGWAVRWCVLAAVEAFIILALVIWKVE